MSTQFKESLEDLVFINFELAPAIEYYNEMESYVEQSKNSYEEKLKQVIKILSINTNEEAENNFDKYNNQLHHYINNHPQMIRRTVFLEIYFLFERYMNIKCEALKEEMKLPIGYKLISGNGLERTKIYLTKMCSIKEPFKNEIWNTIMIYGKVRNSLAHNQSLITRKEDANVKQLAGLEVEHKIDQYTFSFTLSESFVPKFYETITQFVTLLKEDRS
ncbi:hypothetical protein [Bacillus sp. I-2]|uniref:hypothetical protein n=1 Tax=Bacillus sp. I-2 TaxID=1857572 RepID=UPI000977EC17|nr:hypothetical protein [Bacillus sp. I-2]OMP28874.1 hypothetical protein BAE31_01775 [Bacillus sp. I-2]